MPIDPGTSPKQRYELIKASLFVIIGALICITVVYSFAYREPTPIEEPIVSPTIENMPVISPDFEETTTTSEVPDTIYQDAKSIMPE